MRRLVLPAILATALLTPPWSAFRMDSGLDQAGAAVACLLDADAGPPAVAVRPDRPPLRVVTYNLHSGLGSRWRLFAPRAEVERNLGAIARHIAASAPAASPVDAVGLNEVDFGSRRSGWLDQAAFLAAELHRLTGATYHIVRSETWRRDLPGMEVRFGNAALLRHPVLAVQACLLGEGCAGGPPATRPIAARFGGIGLLLSEPRGLLRIRIDHHGHPVELLVTHLEAFAAQQREAQAREILSHFVRSDTPTLLLGDMNTVETASLRQHPQPVDDPTHAVLAGGPLVDARLAVALATGRNDLSGWATYPAQTPRWPLDGVFATPDLAPLVVRVIGGEESDHRGLMAHYAWLTEAAATLQRRWHDTVRGRRLGPASQCAEQPPQAALGRVRLSS